MGCHIVRADPDDAKSVTNKVTRKGAKRLLHMHHIGAVVADEHHKQRLAGEVAVANHRTGTNITEGERRAAATEARHC
jgi:hypothetical protein